MAQVPYSPLSTVEPSTPAAYQRVEASPDAFGAGIGRAEQQLGGQIERSADIINIAARDFQKRQDDIDVDAAYANQFSPAFRDLYQKYYSLQGKDAVDGMPTFLNQMQELRTQSRDALPNDRQKHLFDQLSRRRVEMEMDGMARYADTQNKVYRDTTFASSLDNTQRQMADKYNDEAAFGIGLGEMAYTTEKYALATGKSSEWLRDKTAEQHSEAAANRVQRWMLDDPVAAQKWYDANKSMIEPKMRLTIEHNLKSAVLPVEIRGKADQGMREVLGPNSTADIQRDISGNAPFPAAGTLTSNAAFPDVSNVVAGGSATRGPDLHRSNIEVLTKELARKGLTDKQAAPLAEELNKEKALLAAALNVAGLQASPADSVPRASWGARQDGTPKGTGFLGVLRTPAGNVVSEYTIGVKIDGKQIDVPTLVPTLTRAEVEGVLRAADDPTNKTPLPPGVEIKARKFAETRLFDGLSVFAEAGETPSAPNVGTGEQVTHSRDIKAKLGDLMAWAEKQYPNDLVKQDALKAQLSSRIRTQVAIFEAAQNQAHSTLTSIVSGGPDGKGVKPTTIEELTATPEGKQAWAMLPPEAQRGMVGWLEHNQKASEDRPSKVNAKLVQDAFARIYLPPDDPRAITSERQLTPLIAQGLTPAGFDSLKKELNGKDDFGTDKQHAVALASSMLTHSILGSSQPEMALEAGLRFRADLEARIAKYREAGKDPRDLITPGKPDYALAPARVMSFLSPPSTAVTTPGGAAVAIPAAAYPEARNPQTGERLIYKGGKWQKP